MQSTEPIVSALCEPSLLICRDITSCNGHRGDTSPHGQFTPPRALQHEMPEDGMLPMLGHVTRRARLGQPFDTRIWSQSRQRGLLLPMSASVNPTDGPFPAEAELRSQPLYHSRGSGSFSGTAYSVPGVSQRSACRSHPLVTASTQSRHRDPVGTALHQASCHAHAHRQSAHHTATALSTAA